MSGLTSKEMLQFQKEKQDLLNDLKERFSNPLYHAGEAGAKSQESRDDVYNFSYPHRGLALVISNRYFTDERDDRNGTEYDERALKYSLESLGFHLEIFNDLKAWQMRLVAEKAATLYSHKNADCFLCVVLTHGEETSDPENDIDVRRDILYDKDGKSIFTGDIVHFFNDTNCPSLTDKPRLFFIQACRGTGMDKGVLAKMEMQLKQAGDSPSTKDGAGLSCLKPSCLKGSYPSISISPSLLYKDCLIMYATPSGYLAWLNEGKGSWLIQELCNFLNSEDVGKRSFLQGLTTVMRAVAFNFESNCKYNPKRDGILSDLEIKNMNEKHGKKEMPVLETQLTKDIYMLKKN